MHSSLVLLTVCSIILIILMITCFICFIRSRRKEDEELMERVQYNNAAGRHQQLQFGAPDPQHQQQQHQMALANQRQMMASQSTPQRRKQLSQSPSANMLIINDSTINQLGTNPNHESQFSYDPNNPPSGGQMMADYQAARRAAGYNVPGSSPYHNMGQTSTAQRQETRSDITQQINSAIIGSSEAEFQNDFIQVFPMYQIAPQPEKNTTPYLT